MPLNAIKWHKMLQNKWSIIGFGFFLPGPTGLMSKTHLVACGAAAQAPAIKIDGV